MRARKERFKEDCEGLAIILTAIAKIITALALFVFALSDTGWFGALAQNLGRLRGNFP
jgi:hypothetical protein